MATTIWSGLDAGIVRYDLTYDAVRPDPYGDQVNITFHLRTYRRSSSSYFGYQIKWESMWCNGTNWYNGIIKQNSPSTFDFWTDCTATVYLSGTSCPGIRLIMTSPNNSPSGWYDTGTDISIAIPAKQTRTYTMSIAHWSWGFQKQEGNNGDKSAFHLQDTYFTATGGSSFSMPASRGITPPNGFALRPTFGSGFTGSWVIYNMGTSFTANGNYGFEYDYSPITYSISYTMNGGTNNSSNPTSYNVLYGVTFANPSRTGYRFANWTIGGSAVTGINPGANASFSSVSDMRTKCGSRTTGNKTVVANWNANTYTIKYNGNGNTGGSTASSSHTYGTAKNLTANGFTKTGYTFAGWATSASGSVVYSNQQSVKNLTSTHGGTVNLYAKWNINTYSVTMRPGGGTYAGSTSNQTFSGNYNTTKAISYPTPPTGHVFAGYYTTGPLSGISTKQAIFEGGVGQFTVYNNSSNGTVTHTRESNTSVPNRSMGSSDVGYQMKIVKAAGTASPGCGGFYTGTSSAANKVYRHIIWAKIPVGYTINDYRNSIGDGGYSTWLTERKGTGNWYRYVYEVHTGSSGSFSTFGHVALTADNGNNSAAVTWYVCASQVTDITSGLTYTYTSSNSIECFYAPLKSTITYNANGGSGAPGAQEYTYASSGTTTLSATKPTRTGYTFLGWSLSSTATSASYTAGQGWNLNNTGNYTLYAVWKVNTYTVAYNANGGEGTTASSSHTYGVSKALTTNGFTRIGYTFLGWSTDSAATSATYTNGQSVSNLTSTNGATVTLYAIWAMRAPYNVYTDFYIYRDKITIDLIYTGITSNNVVYYKTAEASSYSTVDIGTETTYTFTELQPNTEYYFYTKMTNGGGTTTTGTEIVETKAYLPANPDISISDITINSAKANLSSTAETNAENTNYTVYHSSTILVNTYDMAIRTMDDGSIWARIFYHNTKQGAVLFTSLAEIKSTQTIDKYSRLGQLNEFKKADGNFEFMLRYPNYSSTLYNRWIQTSNPIEEYVATSSSGTSTATGYTAIHIDWTSNNWGGLTRHNSDANSISTCYLSGSVGSTNWFYAIGATTTWGNGIPGAQPSPDTGTVWGAVELWVRIDDIGTITSVNAGTATSATLSSLTEDTGYSAWMSVSNAFGTNYSKKVDFTTNWSTAKIYHKNSGSWMQGEAYHKINGAWVRAKNVYVKVNGTWKPVK